MYSTSTLRSGLEVFSKLRLDSLCVLNKRLELLKDHLEVVNIANLFSEVIIYNAHNEIAEVEVSSGDFVSSEEFSSVLSKSG